MFLFYFYFLEAVGIEPKASCLCSKHSTREPQPQPETVALGYINSKVTKLTGHDDGLYIKIHPRL